MTRTLLAAGRASASVSLASGAAAGGGAGARTFAGGGATSLPMVRFFLTSTCTVRVRPCEKLCRTSPQPTVFFSSTRRGEARVRDFLSSGSLDSLIAQFWAQY